MDEDSPARFKIDYWYKAFVVLGAAGTIAAVAFELKGIANAHALLVALGMFLLGIGEWVNHPFQSGFWHSGGGVGPWLISGHPRKPSNLGNIFDLLGLALLAAGLYKITQAA